MTTRDATAEEALRPTDTTEPPVGPDLVKQVRTVIDLLRLAPPERVPTQALALSALAPSHRKALETLARRAMDTAAHDRAQLAALVRTALDLLPPLADAAQARVSTERDQAPEPHDAYFGIRRSQEPADPAYLRGLLQGLQVFTGNALDEADHRAYGVIPQALCLLWCDALGQPVSAGARAVGSLPPPMWRLNNAPIERWLLGHQVFAVLTQGLIWSMHQLAHWASEADDPTDGATVALKRVELLFDASAASFRFTADFDPHHYRDTLRPSMCEPHVPKGFSGTLSCDHAHLVRLMAELREPLAKLQARHAVAYAAMGKALAAVYDDHKLICEHFDGANGPSLKGAGSRQGSELSGADMLARFKQRRVSMIG